MDAAVFNLLARMGMPVPGSASEAYLFCLYAGAREPLLYYLPDD